MVSTTPTDDSTNACGASPDFARSPAYEDAERHEMLRRSAVFSSLEECDLDRLLEASTILRLAPGDTLFRRGDAGDEVFFILEGSVAVEADRCGGRSVPMNSLKTGEIVGEMAVLRDTTRSARVSAVEACEFLVIPRSEFLALLVGHPAIAIQVLGSVTNRLGRLTEVVEALDS